MIAPSVILGEGVVIHHPDLVNLWAGQAHELVQARLAGEIVRDMAAEAVAALDRVSGALRRRGS